MPPACFDFVIVGSGFGGSVSAMRLAEKGYSVAVLERGRRFRDEDFARTTWNLRRYLWAPALRCFGILQISPFRDVFVLHGAGVGGGSLGYANVLMQPDDSAFATSAWRRLAEWGDLLRPHYATARRMLGVAPNPRPSPADALLHEIADELGAAATFHPTPVGTFFGEPGREGEEVPDPYFGGQGPSRRGCLHCGACMVGCRYNAKNTLPKNYLYFAEKWGARIEADATVRDVVPLSTGQPDGARYEVVVRRTSAIVRRGTRRIRARNVVLAAGALGTLRLLFRCRDVTRSLPGLSPRLGDLVRTNNEALLGVTARSDDADYSKGVAITSIFRADPVTTVEPVRYPAGSSFMRFLAAPMRGTAGRLEKLYRWPMNLLRAYVLPRWAQRTTIILVMQTVDNHLRLRLGRSVFTAFRRDLVSRTETGTRPPARSEIGHRVTEAFARRIDGVPAGSINERLLGIPMTAHILGGCPMGGSAEDGVVDAGGEVHGHPGLYVVDGSIVPGNPGVNPSLTIAALAEYAMSRIPGKAAGRGDPQPAALSRSPAPDPAPARSG